jgi:rubrerythrin
MPSEQPGAEQELAAARARTADLAEQLAAAERRHRRELDELREEMGRELMRRSFAAADREWGRRGPGSPATLVAAEYEATTSWRLTKPLRALGRLIRRDS